MLQDRPQSPCTPVDQGHAMDCLCGSHSIHIVTDQLLHPPLTALNDYLFSQLISLIVTVSPLLQFPHPRAPILSSLLSSSVVYFILPSHICILTILSSGQAFLIVFRRCPVRNFDSVDIFLMHPWREVHCMSTYSSAILIHPGYILK